MSAPSKPWEQDRMTQGRILHSSAPMLQAMPNGARGRPGPPNVPPRPSLSSIPSNYIGASSYPSYGRSMGMGYSPYNSYNHSYSGYGGYGNYGGMYGGMHGAMGGGMYGNHGYGYGPESRFIQLAEESTRPAFEGIESLVRAFGSIAMMFDSTFFAVQSSFRAVLGVAENFGRIRSMFGQLWASFTLLRFFRWCYSKLLSMFGFQVAQDVGKAAWNEAVREAGSGETNLQNSSSWPIFMFLAMIVSAPYLISKLLPPVIDKRDPKNWISAGKLASAVYEFKASNPQELTMLPDDPIVLAPLEIQREMNLTGTGWAYASSERGAGIVPLSFCQSRKDPGNPISVSTSASRPMVDRTNISNEGKDTKVVEKVGESDDPNKLVS